MEKGQTEALPPLAKLSLASKRRASSQPPALCSIRNTLHLSLPLLLLPCWASATHSGVQGPFIHSAVSSVPIRASGQHREEVTSLEGAKKLWVPLLHNSKPCTTVPIGGSGPPPAAHSIPEGDL